MKKTRKKEKASFCDKNPHFHLSTLNPKPTLGSYPTHHNNIGKLGTKEGKRSTTNQQLVMQQSRIGISSDIKRTDLKFL
jgi:hypothetical protein